MRFPIGEVFAFGTIVNDPNVAVAPATIATRNPADVYRDSRIPAPPEMTCSIGAYHATPSQQTIISLPPASPCPGILLDIRPHLRRCLPAPTHAPPPASRYPCIA